MARYFLVRDTPGATQELAILEIADLPDLSGSYQVTLTSGTNIKTINGVSLLGSGDMAISTGGGTWGSITGTVSNQTDLVSFINSAISAAGLTIGTGLTNTTGTISADLSTGKAGGGTVNGGTAASENLTLNSTTNGTKGFIRLGSGAYYDETLAGWDRIFVQKTALTGSVAPSIKVTNVAHTGLTANTEFNEGDFGGASVTQQWSAGTVATQRFWYFRGRTVSTFSPTGIFTNPYNVYIAAIVAGTNTTFSNGPWSLGVENKSKFFYPTGTNNGVTIPDDGVNLTTDVAAVNGTQQAGVPLVLESLGWGTTLGTSQSVKFRISNVPIQSTIPYGRLNFEYKFGAGAWTTAFTYDGSLNTIAGINGLTFTNTAPSALAVQTLYVASNLLRFNRIGSVQAYIPYADATAAADRVVLYTDAVAHKSSANFSFATATNTMTVVGTVATNGFKAAISAVKTANYTAVAGTDYTILCNATSAGFTVSLPAVASTPAGTIFIIKKVASDVSANAVTIDPNGAELIENASTLAITTSGQAKQVQTDGTAWHVIN